MTTLLIAEKPSVARELAQVLGDGHTQRQDGGLVSGERIFAWCFGHLCELARPEDYAPAWGLWRLDTLPMVPAKLEFETRARSADAQKQLAILKQLVAGAEEIVNACDAGREGELIFWWVMRSLGWGKGLPAGEPGPSTVTRLWLTSMTAPSIRASWEARRPIAEYAGLAAAAAARAEADWLLGLNLTRAASLVLPRSKNDPVWPVGRVQTPVLAEVVRRDLAIEAFAPQSFWKVEVSFAGEGTPYVGLLQATPAAALGANLEQFAARATAAALEAAVTAHTEPWVVVEEAKERQEKAPPLYNLTELQRHAAKLYGGSPKETLGLAQSLYEKGLLTYPRTESSCLPDDYRTQADLVATAIAGVLGEAFTPTTKPSESTVAQRIFNSAKVSDHFAIIPTAKEISGASFANPNEERLWRLVAQRFVVAFEPDALALQTERSLRAGDLVAIAKGKVYRQEGWRVAARACGLLDETKEPPVLPALSAEHDVATGTELKEGKTKPPAAYNEASLLAMMERVASILEDEDSDDEELKRLQQAIGERGLGTPATRAEIIEGLITRELLERTKGKKGAARLTATQRGRFLIAELKDRGAEALTLPLRTAEWEQDLKAIEQREKGRITFLSELVDDLEDLVTAVIGEAVDGEALDVLCPKTGEPVVGERSWYVFPGWPELKCWREVAKRPMSAEDYRGILQAALNGEPGKRLTGFVSKKKKPFAARLVPDGERFWFAFD